MAPDVTTQVSRYFEHLDELAPPVSFDELEERAGRLQLVPGRPRPRRPRPAWIVAVAAAAAVLLVVGGIAWLLNPGGGDTPVITEPPAPSTTVQPSVPTTGAQPPPVTEPSSPTTSTGITEPVAVAATGWTLQPVDPAVFPPELHVSVRDVTVGGPGLVAVGRSPAEGEFGSPGDAQIWTSEDGITWTRVPHDPQVFGDLHLEAVSTGGPGLVAIGSDFIAEHPQGRNVVLLSEDGLTWTRVEDPSMVGVNVSDVTSGGPGLVAVGFAITEPFDRAVWTSEDGTAWTLVNLEASLVSVVNTGSLLITGSGQAGMFTSLDGATWDLSPPPRVTGSFHLDIAAGPDGVVVTNGDRMWFSPDGLTWTVVPFPGADRPDEVSHYINTVSEFSEGFVAVGSTQNEADESQAAAWTSADGLTWSRVPHDPEIFVDGSMAWVAPGGPGLVVFGEKHVGEGDTQRIEQALWIWTSAER